MSDIIVGLQYGDEGKGKITNCLIKNNQIHNYTHCVRYNGGPNAGHTIYINDNKIGNFETDNNGYFITTMVIPKTENKDRVEFKVKNHQGEEKIVSLRLGNNDNRVTQLTDTKITINGIKNIVNRGDSLEISGTGTPGTAIITEIKNSDEITINSRTAKVDGTGN